jgi:hypothetical protein
VLVWGEKKKKKKKSKNARNTEAELSAIVPRPPLLTLALAVELPLFVLLECADDADVDAAISLAGTRD